MASTKGPLLSKPTPTNTVTQHQKITTTNRPATSPKQESTTIKFVPITVILNPESKTEASNEQQIIEKVSEITTNRNVMSSKIPTTTEENIKLQTFQSVQGKEFECQFCSTVWAQLKLRNCRFTNFLHWFLETTFTTPATTTVSTAKPSRRTTTISLPITSKTTAQPFGVASTVPSVTSTTQVKPRTTTEISKVTTQRTVITEKPTKPTSTVKPTVTKSATAKPASTKPTASSSSKRPDQSQATTSQPTKTTVKPSNHKTTSIKPIPTLSTNKQSTNGSYESSE